MGVLRLQDWKVRCEGWRVLVERGGGLRQEVRECTVETIKELTNQNLRAPDLPMYLTRYMHDHDNSCYSHVNADYPYTVVW